MTKEQTRLETMKDMKNMKDGSAGAGKCDAFLMVDWTARPIVVIDRCRSSVAA